MKRLYPADFIRALSALGIVIFHFSSGMKERGISGPLFLYQSPNFSYGSLFVTLFFILSGAMLHYSFSRKGYSLKAYYTRRFFSIFPAFYLVFFCLHIKAALERHSFFYLGKPFSFLLSLLGLDGYFSYRSATYYQVGEWFLGALILLYLLYPLLNRLAVKRPLLGSFLVLAGYSSVFWGDFYKINDFSNLFSCLLSFWIGILFIQYRSVFLDRPLTGWLCLAPALLSCLVPVPGNSNLLVHLFGALSFLGLYSLGGLLMKLKYLRRPLCFFSRISYGVYLVHHVLLSFFLNRVSQTSWSLPKTALVLLFLVLVILAAGTLVEFSASRLEKFIFSGRKK